MPAPRIAIHGCYNTPNFGDLLLLDLVAQHVARRTGERPVTPWPPSSLRDALLAEPGNGLRSCLGIDAAIFGGGGYFGDRGTTRSARKLLRYSVPATIWRATKTPYVVTGVGAGPALSPVGMRRVLRVCRGARAICMRDDESRDLLVQCGVDTRRIEVTADYVLAMSREDIPEETRQRASELVGQRTPGRRRLGLHLQLVGADEPFLGQLVATAVAALRGRDDIEVFWLADHADAYYLAAKRFGGDALPNVRYIPKQNHWTTAALIGEMDAVITTKLHVAITSWALGGAPCGYSAHGKTKRLFRQIGRSEFQCDLGEPVERVGQWLRLFAGDPEAFAAEDAVARRELPERARRNYAVIDELLDSVG